MRRWVVVISILLAFVVGLWATVAAPAAPAGGVELREQGDRVEISIGGKPFTTYYVAATQAKPYFHPLHAPSGKIITRGWPMVSDIPGESTDHPHHRGMSFTHGDVDGVDFWAEKAKVQGKEVHRKFERVESGPTMGRLTERVDWVTPQGKTIIEEVRDVTFFYQPDARIIDFVITLRAKEGPVTFGDTKEGTFAIRLADPLKEKMGGKIRNSEGGLGMKQTWGKRARWVDYSGALEGEPLGVAIFDHPSSFRHPTYWHVRDYGLFAANPFGVRDFTNDKQQDGRFELKPGSELVLRYRVYIHSGDLTPDQVEAQYKAYATAKPDSATKTPAKRGK